MSMFLLARRLSGCDFLLHLQDMFVFNPVILHDPDQNHAFRYNLNIHVEKTSNSKKMIINFREDFVTGIMISFFDIISAPNFVKRVNSPRTRTMPRGLYLMESAMFNDIREYIERDIPQVGHSYPVSSLKRHVINLDSNGL
jgi:hypothetical protein